MLGGVGRAVSNDRPYPISEATATQSRDRGTPLNTCVTVMGTLILG